MKLHVDLSKDIKLPKEAKLPFFRVALKSVETVLSYFYMAFLPLHLHWPLL